MAKKTPLKKAALPKAVKSQKVFPVMQCFLSCESISREPGTGKPSLHGLFDKINTDSFPAQFKPFFLYIRLAGGDGEFRLMVRRTTPSGKVTDDGSEMTIKMLKGERGDVVIQFAPLHIDKAGLMKFELLLDDEAIGWPIEIPVVKNPKPKKK